MSKVAFKISTRGTRYSPKPKPNPAVFVDDEVDDTTASSVFKLIPARVKCDIEFSKKRSVVDRTEDDDDEDTDDIPDADVSFIVNIFPDGYTIDKSLKSKAAHQIASMYDLRLLRPYDRASQSMFTAIKCCRVPANFFEDIPCTYKNGKVACEVRDWRKDSSEQAGVSISGPSVAATPSIRRVSLRMSVDSIVRDIPQMSKRDIWAYSELLEVEAKTLLSLYPKLDLDPYPNFDRLCKKPGTVKLNLDFHAMRRKRLRPMPVAEKSNLKTDPNVANPVTQNVDQRPTTDQLTPNVPLIPAENKLTQTVRQPTTMHQLIQNVGQRPAMDQPKVVNLATQNVGQCNTTVPNPRNHAPNTSIPKFPQPEDQFSASGTAFNAPGASSTHALVNLSSGNDDINSIMSAFDGRRGNQDRRQSSSMAKSNNRTWSDPLALIGNHQQMTLEILDNTPGTAFNASRASNTRSMSFPSANDGRTVNQDGQSSFPMAFLDGRTSQSNSLVYLGNQQQQASHMQHNPARTSVNAAGASSSHGLMNLNSNNGGTLADVVNQHQLIPLHNQNTSGTTPLSAPGASSRHGMMSLNSNNDGISSTLSGLPSSVAYLDYRNQSNPLDDLSSIVSGLHGQSSYMVNADNKNQSNPLAILSGLEGNDCSPMANNQQQQIATNQHGKLSSGSDNDDLWSFMSAFNGNQQRQIAGSSLMDKSNAPDSQWNKKGQSPVNITVKEEPSEFSSGSMKMKFGAVGSLRRQPVDIITIEDEPVPRISSLRPPKSGEFSSGATQRQYRAAATSSSSRPKPTQIAETSRSKPILSGIHSSSTSVQRELDRRTQDRFTKIGLLTARYKLNCKELKVDDYKPTKNITSSQLNYALINSDDNETLIDETCEMPLSMSHAGGNVNLCKTRILKFVKEAQSYPAGDEEILVPRSETKLILSERQSDGSVTMHYCEFDDYDHLAEEELLPTFPNTHTADMFAAEFCSLMKREGYTVAGDYLQAKPINVSQLSDVQRNRAIGPAVISSKPCLVGTSNASCSTSTHNMWMNAEGGGFSVSSPSSPISDALKSLIQTSDAMVLTSDSVSTGQDLSMQQQLDFNPVSQKPTPVLRKQSQRRQGNMMPPGNVAGTGRNIGGGNSMVGGQGSGTVRRGVPRSGRMGASPLSIFDVNPTEINEGSTITTASIRRAIILGRSRGQSSNAGGSQGGNIQVPSGSGAGSGSESRGRGSRGRGSRGQGPLSTMALSKASALGEFGEQSSNAGGGNLQVPSGIGSGSRGRGSRGRGSRGRGLRGRGSRGRGSDITPENHMNRRQINGRGRQPRVALDSSLTSGASNTSVVRIGNVNIDSSLISGSGSRGLLERSTSGIIRASDMNQNQMQQQTNLQPASVSTSVVSGTSRPSVNATNQDGASSSKDWIDDEFLQKLMT